MADAQSGAANGELMDIGTVAAHNIANALGLGEDKVLTIRNAIRDEISAMGSHFSLAVADVQTGYEVEVNKLAAKYNEATGAIKAEADKAIATAKSDATFLKAHKPFFSSVVGVSLIVGVLLGHFFW